jgi:hypothetical protein
VVAGAGVAAVPGVGRRGPARSATAVAPLVTKELMVQPPIAPASNPTSTRPGANAVRRAAGRAASPFWGAAAAGSAWAAATGRQVSASASRRMRASEVRPGKPMGWRPCVRRGPVH